MDPVPRRWLCALAQQVSVDALPATASSSRAWGSVVAAYALVRSLFTRGQPRRQRGRRARGGGSAERALTPGSAARSDAPRPRPSSHIIARA